MSNRRCPKLWQAEAIHDGRLAGVDADSFERHAATCQDCAEEARGLASLGERMRVVAAPDPSPLELRRMRAAVLQRAHARPSPARLRPRTAWLAFTIAALVVLGVAAWPASQRLGASRGTASVVTGVAQPVAPTFDLTNVAGAVMTTRTENGTTRVDLSDGVAAFHVEHLAASMRFLVELPDGEIEVRGTRFVVTVHEGRTRAVGVSEGAVALRLRGAIERTIEAGQGWQAPRISTSAEAKVTVVEPPPTPAPLALDPRAPTTPVSSPLATSSAPPTEAPLPASAIPSVDAARAAASDRFSRAVAAFQGGDYAVADRLLSSFAGDFPRDARVEDATFLRAIAHARMGDSAGAAAIARSYLAAFPRGLRRREAERLAGQ